MYNDKPNSLMPALLLTFAALFAFFAFKIPPTPDWKLGIKLVFALIALFLGAWGIGSLTTYIIDLISYGRQSLYETSYTMMLANAIGGLSQGSIDFMNRHGVIEVLGVVGDNLEIAWRIRSDPMDIDWEFAQGFIRMSEAYYPNLLPVGRANEVVNEHGLFFVNYERQAQSLTNLLIHSGLARPGRGNQSGVLLVEFEQVAEKFGV